MLETPDRKAATTRYSLSERFDRRPVVAAAKGFLRHGGLTSSAALAFYFLPGAEHAVVPAAGH